MVTQKQKQKQEDEVKERVKTRRESLSKFFYNLAQTCFTAMVVGGTVTFFISSNVAVETYVTLFVMGIISTSVFAYIGNNILNK